MLEVSAHLTPGVARLVAPPYRRRIIGRPGENDEPREWQFIGRLRALGRNPQAARQAWRKTTKARGLQAARAGRVKEAIRLFETARATLPYPDSEIDVHLKELRLIRRLEQRLEVHPNDTAALLELGKAYFAQDRAEAALACFQRAVSLAPASAEAHSLVALELHYRGEYDGAIASYRTALRLMPGHPRASLFLPDALRHQSPGTAQVAQATPVAAPPPRAS